MPWHPMCKEQPREPGTMHPCDAQKRFHADRVVLCIWVLFLSLFMFTGHGETPEEESPARNTYVLRGSHACPPYQFMEKGKVTGFSVELVLAIARTMELDLHIALGPEPYVRRLLETEQVDGVLGIIQHQASPVSADTSFPLVKSSYTLFVRRGTPIKSLEDVQNATIILLSGYNTEALLEKTGFQGNIRQIPSPVVAFERLARGDGDALLMEHRQGTYLRWLLNRNTVVPAVENLFPCAISIVIAKEHETFKQQLNEGLRKIIASGEFFDIWTRWFKDSLRPVPNLTFQYLGWTLSFVVALLFIIAMWIVLLQRTVKNRTKALREREEQYRTLFENGNDALFVVQDRLINCNQRACELMGVSRETVLNARLEEFSPALQPDGSESCSAFRKRVEAALSGKPQIFNWMYVRADGVPVYTEVSLRALPGSSEPLYIAAVRDLSPRIKAEQAARRQQDLVRAITATSPVGIVMLDTEGVITFANAHAEHILRLESVSLEQRTYNDPRWYITDMNGGPFPDEDLPFHRVKRTGKPAYDIVHAIEHPEGGKTILSVSAAPLLADTGEFDGVVAILENITAKVEEEAERETHWQRLERQQAKLIHIARTMSLTENNFTDLFQLIVTSAAEVLAVSFSSLWVLNENHTRLRCIASSSGEMEPVQNTKDLDISACPAYLEALEAGRHVDAADARHDPRTVDLVERYLDPNKVGALLDAPVRLGGKLTGVLCNEHHDSVRYWHPDELQFAAELADQAAQALAFQDRFRAERERQALEAQIQQAQKLESLGILAGGIAHDFNNLLTAILGNVDLAILDIPETSPAEAALNEIKTVANRAADLCRSMLSYAGRDRLFAQPLNLNEEIRQTTQMMASLITRNTRVLYRFGEKLPLVNADKSQMQQVVMNLMLNAAESIKDGKGTITVNTFRVECDAAYFKQGHFTNIPAEGVYAAIEISDTGSGMDAATQEKIFNPFFSTKFVGRGMGLSAVLGIVHRHKGCIRTESKPNEGSVFTVLLPGDAEVCPAPKPGDTATASYDGSSGILLVDGNSISRDVTTRILTRLGYTVHHAGDPVEAANYLRREPDSVQCILLDHAWNDVIVGEQIESLRPLCNGAPMILATDLEKQEAQRLYGLLGFTEFLVKPLRVNILAARLGALIKR